MATKPLGDPHFDSVWPGGHSQMLPSLRPLQREWGKRGWKHRYYPGSANGAPRHAQGFCPFAKAAEGLSKFGGSPLTPGLTHAQPQDTLGPTVPCWALAPGRLGAGRDAQEAGCKVTAGTQHLQKPSRGNARLCLGASRLQVPVCGGDRPENTRAPVSCRSVGACPGGRIAGAGRKRCHSLSCPQQGPMSVVS